MKALPIHLLFFATIFGLCISCQSRHTYLGKTEILLATNPEAALACLDSILPTACRGKENLAAYHFLRWHATFLAEGNLDHYLLTPEAAIYWEKKHEYDKAAWLWLYNSITPNTSFTPGDAARYLEKSRQLSERLQDSLLTFHIHYYQGKLFFRNRAYPEGVDAFRQAMEKHPHVPVPNTAPYWVKVAECCLYTDNYQTATECYERAKECIAKGQDSLSAIRSFFQSLRHIRNERTKECLLEDWTDYFKQDAYALTCHRLVKAEAFLRNRQTDSAKIYLEKVKAELPAGMTELSLPFQSLQGKYYFQCGDYKQAAQVYKNFLHQRDSLRMSLSNDRLQQIIAGYNQIHLEQEIKLLHLERLGLTLGIGIIVLTGAVIFLWLLRLKRHREEKLEEAEQMVGTLQSLCRQQNEQGENMKLLLMNELELSKQLTYLSSQELPKHRPFLDMYDKMLGHIRSAELNWEKFYKLTDCLFDNFHQKLEAHPETLTEKDIQYLCLLQGGFRADEIAFVMKISVPAVHKRKTNLRKKFETEERGDLLASVDNWLQKKV